MTLYPGQGLRHPHFYPWGGAPRPLEATSRAKRQEKGPETVGGGLRPSNSNRHIVTDQGYKSVTSRLRALNKLTLEANVAPPVGARKRETPSGCVYNNKGGLDDVRKSAGGNL
jgi:hypothetical protein